MPRNEIYYVYERSKIIHRTDNIHWEADPTAKGVPRISAPNSFHITKKVIFCTLPDPADYSSSQNAYITTLQWMPRMDSCMK
jgi:hypothetical protein